MTQAYPLIWPIGLPRTKGYLTSRFKTSLPGAVRNVTEELRRFGADSGKKVESVVVSANVTLMNDRPSDPGVACYFTWDRIQCCIAVDRYHWPEENLQAISLIIEAERTKLRHGGLNIVRAAFRGYASLPPPVGADGALAAPWWDVLEIPEGSTLAIAKTAYLEKVKKTHPDRGGDAAAFNRVVDAYRQAQEQFA